MKNCSTIEGVYCFTFFCTQTADNLISKAADGICQGVQYCPTSIRLQDTHINAMPFTPIVKSRLRLKFDGTRAETRFSFSAKRTSPFKSHGASVQSTTGRRAVHISLQGLYCSCKPMFCSHVTLTGYPLHSPVSPSLFHPCLPSEGK
jgi:hypothetical protein